VGESIAPPIVKDAEIETEATEDHTTTVPVVYCDRCGSPMIERSCKLMCRNCGSRMDCSDLSIYLD
jgi:exosome complex RNA-binding protein Csl4